MLSRMSNFSQRLVVGFLSLTVILSAVYFSSYPYFRPFFAVITSALIGGAVWEYYRMARGKPAHPLEGLGVLGSVVYGIVTFWCTQEFETFLFPGIILGFMLLLGFIHFLSKEGRPFFDLAVTFFPIMYLTVPLTLLININYYFPGNPQQDGRWWLLFLLITTKATDMGGYFIGKLFGRTKLAPEVSPKKTWEGTIGGVLTSLVASWGIMSLTEWLFPEKIEGMHLGWMLVFALFISILAQIGDLSESLLKRDVGVKDSNHLPGLGGLLDMMDSLVFTTPMVYIYLKLFYP